MAYKQNPGRGPMMKTGKGVPSALLQEDQKKKDEKSGTTKPSFPGATWTRPANETKPNTVNRVLEDRWIKNDSLLATNQENRALLSGNLPEGARPYQPRGIYKGYGGNSYYTNIDSTSGDTTFSMGRSDQKLTVPRRNLMTMASRGKLKDFLLGSFKDNGYLRNK